MNAQALSLPPSISCNKPFFIKGLLRRGSLKSKWKQTEGREGSSLSLCLLCGKNSQIFQTANRVPSNKLLDSYFFLYIWTCKYYCYYCIYTSVKNIAIFYVEFRKKIKNSFLSFHSSIFHSKIHKHPACKMNRDEHGESRLKIRSFEWTYFLNDPKVFLLQLRSIF